MFQSLKIFKWLLLYPVSLIYRFIVGIRNILYDLNILNSHTFDFPVISIGNLSAGGTGKTPHVEFIAGHLKDKYKIAVLSRGYKRKTKGYIEAAEADHPQKIGDEPLQIKNKHPEITVSVDEKRKRGINILRNNNKIKSVILDDAFQHRKIVPGLNILLTSYNKPFTKDQFLPLGKLREHAHEHKRAHIIIITKCPETINPLDIRIMRKELKIYPFQFLFFTKFEYGDLINVFDKENTKAPGSLTEKNYDILGVSGIADNKMFKNKLNELSEKVRVVKYFDHHNYRKTNVSRVKRQFNKLNGENKIIITTEKDAVKLRHLDVDEDLKRYIFYLPVRVKFIGENKEEEFINQINHYVRTNRRYSKLYKGKD